MTELLYQSDELRLRLDAWGRVNNVNVDERLVEVLADCFDTKSASVLNAWQVADTMVVRLASPLWPDHKELAVLPTGGVAW